jgi:hypothetical protein
MGKLPQVLSVVSQQEPFSVLPLHNPRATTLLHRSTSLHLPVVIGLEANPCGMSTAAYGSVLEFKCATNRLCLLSVVRVAGKRRWLTPAQESRGAEGIWRRGAHKKTQGSSVRPQPNARGDVPALSLQLHRAHPPQRDGVMFKEVSQGKE